MNASQITAAIEKQSHVRYNMGNMKRRRAANREPGARENAEYPKAKAGQFVLETTMEGKQSASAENRNET